MNPSEMRVMKVLFCFIFVPLRIKQCHKHRGNCKRDHHGKSNDNGHGNDQLFKQ